MLIKKIFSRNVSIDDLRIDDLYYYKIEGHGGKPIENWPVYSFFHEYVNGNKVSAKKLFVKWYRKQFVKYYNKPKQDGGMHKGSLYMLIENEFNKSGLKFDEISKQDLLKSDTLSMALEKRVEQRFALVDSIKEKGYVPNHSDFVIGVKSKSDIILKSGHHRAAALKALGYDTIPQVSVYPGNKACLVAKKIRKMVKHVI